MPLKPSYQLDKSISVPPGQTVRTGYVHVDCIILACKDKMCIASVKEKYELILQNAANSIYPTPIGEWRNDRFVLIDGRHTFIAYVINGYQWVLVSWLEG